MFEQILLDPARTVDIDGLERSQVIKVRLAQQILFELEQLILDLNLLVEDSTEAVLDLVSERLCKSLLLSDHPAQLRVLGRKNDLHEVCIGNSLIAFQRIPLDDSHYLLYLDHKAILEQKLRNDSTIEMAVRSNVFENHVGLKFILFAKDLS